jgi:twitching motility protein PilT
MGGYDSELSKIVAELNRAAPSQQKAAPIRVPGSLASLDGLLQLAAARNASDVLLIAGAPTVLRVNGALSTASGGPLDAEEVRAFVLPLVEAGQMEELQKKRTLDFSFMREGLGRFRINLHYQRGTLAASIRLLPAKIPSLESLHLPGSLARLAERRQGLVLVTGPTGCGKTSTLAALVDIVNTRRAAHVVTIEDPVEYQHANRSAIIEQIEVGRDTPDFAITLRSIMRQTPDVILVGEMRDLETIGTALHAAETGHMVFSTLHTLDAVESINRIIAIFPPPEQKQIRLQLAAVLRAIVSQRLVRRSDAEGRVPAVEVMVTTAYIRECILVPEKTRAIREAISAGTSQYGMQTFDQSLWDLFQAGLVNYETALESASNADEFKLRMQGIASTSDISRQSMQSAGFGR